MRTGLSAGMLALLTWGCTQSTAPEEAVQARAWRSSSEALQAPGSADVGEDCSSGGDEVCATGICLHSLLDYRSGYFCSAACLAPENCPDGWPCLPMLPGRNDLAFCVPPEGWNGQQTAIARPYRPDHRAKAFVDDPGRAAPPDLGNAGKPGGAP